ncbi:MAG: L-rhamnose isomerase [Verrucomicrobiales bacterium]|jgi:L-rhamnose isomerase|nr:L-rhamnose isomerase [Verrucomicrobiales bacterium]
MNTYSIAQECYAALGVDTEQALRTLTAIPLSLHCWQGDDVGGFERIGTELGGGLAVTGNYPGKARSIDELRRDLEKALTLIPGRHRLNLHACYADLNGRKIDRDKYTVREFQSWIDWAKSQKLGMDFNPTCFSHPLANDGFTLSHANREIRQFWINHCIASRRIGAEIGRQLGTPCVTNIWIPDGSKDLPADRLAPRQRLAESLDLIFNEPLDTNHHLDAVESKLFGIGSESYVVGSHEFYLGYAVKNQKLLCLDAGHFHPTESIADKISAVLQFVPEILLHVSRGVRWDSDHVVILDDATKTIMQELVRGDFIPRTHIGLDFFDASINRLAAWIIGTRATQQALLLALLEPAQKLRDAENARDYTSRLALLEAGKSLPFGAVWEEFCRRQNVPHDYAWLAEVKAYENDVLAKR